MPVQPLRVRELMSTDLYTVSPDTEIMQAVHLLVENDISGLLVVNDQQHLLGILTERDCIRIAALAGYHDEAGGRVADYMSTGVRTANPDDSVMELAELFAESPFRRCPVVEDGRLVGLICRRDILRALQAGAWFSAEPQS